jgi:hypothetical protein
LHPVPDYNLYQVILYENSIKDEYYTFTTPEAKAAIDDYWYFRQRCGEQLPQNSFLYVHYYDPNNLLLFQIQEK